MKRNKQYSDFLNIGIKLLKWYEAHSRDLPWRMTIDPYKIWISEIILQQTQVKQGLQYFLNFTERFPDVKSLASAETDEVLTYWKGLGYYSRALNLHKAAKQIVSDFSGEFPSNYDDILKLKGVGKYTAAAVSSICFNERKPAVDGNFYRVFSRVFADDFDVSSSKSFDYFSELAFRVMPKNDCGAFNQAVMDLGSEVCKPKNPLCETCPLNQDCLAFQTGTVLKFPVKTKKTKVEEMELRYYFMTFKDTFLIRRRDESSIWKKLYEFPNVLPETKSVHLEEIRILEHKLSHRLLKITIYKAVFSSIKELEKFAKNYDYTIISFEESHLKSFPKPLQNYIENLKP